MQTSKKLELITPLNNLKFKLNNELTEGIPIGHLYNLRMTFTNNRIVFEYEEFCERISNTNNYLLMTIESFYKLNYRRIING